MERKLFICCLQVPVLGEELWVLGSVPVTFIHLCLGWLGRKINGFAPLTKMLLTTRVQETIKIPLTQLFTMEM